MSQYHSQHGEDAWIAENLKPDIGTFCEVGAFDGVLSSNTLYFERQGWKGVLVEADPILAAQAMKNRQAIVQCCAAASQQGLVEFHVNEQDRGLSGIIRPGKSQIVCAYTIVELCQRVGCFHIDLMSIDTEGTELDVWEGVKPMTPGIVIMEYRTCDEPPQDKAIVAQMKKDGYKEAHRTLCNLIFVR